VVGVLAAQVVYVQGDKSMIDKTLKELVRQLAVKSANHAALEGQIHDQPGAAGKINDNTRKCFVQRYIGMAIAANAFLVTDCLVHCLPQGNANVFHGVVTVHMQIANGADVQVQHGVTGNLIEHMVKETNPGMQA